MVKSNEDDTEQEEHASDEEDALDEPLSIRANRKTSFDIADGREAPNGGCGGEGGTGGGGVEGSSGNVARRKPAVLHPSGP